MTGLRNLYQIGGDFKQGLRPSVMHKFLYQFTSKEMKENSYGYF
jgi:hypothetical protein